MSQEEDRVREQDEGLLTEEEAIKACKTGLPSNTPWREIAEAQHQKDEQKIGEAKKKVVDFIESYLVTTVHPEGNMHHIDDKEWQSVKLRLLRQSLKDKYLGGEK